MKSLVIIIAAIFTLSTVKANETPKALETVAVNAQTVKVKANLDVKANETYEIQKSYDNKNFTTIAVLMGTEDAANMPAFSMNDKVTKDSKVYYRIVKANETVATASIN